MTHFTAKMACYANEVVCNACWYERLENFMRCREFTIIAVAVGVIAVWSRVKGITVDPVCGGGKF